MVMQLGKRMDCLVRRYPALARIVGLLFVGLSACAPHGIKAPPLLPLDEQARQQFRQAEALYAKGSGRALPAYEAFLSHYPQTVLSDDALFRIATIHFNQQEYEDAHREFEQLLNSYPGSDLVLETRYQLGLTAHSLGRYKEAVETLTAVVDRIPDAGKKERGFVLVIQDLIALDRPVDALREAIRFRDGTSDSSTRQLAEQTIATIIEQNLRPQQVDHLRQEIRDDVVRSQLFFRSATLAYALGDRTKAEQLFDGFIREYPEDVRRSDAEVMLKRLRESQHVESARIGVLLPLSGKFEPIGRQVLEGIMLATNLFGANADRSGIELIVRDTAASPAQAIQAVEDLVLIDHVIAILGPLSATVSSGAAKRAQEFGIPIISFSSDDRLTALGDYVFQHALTKRQQVQTLVAHAVKERGVKRVAILYPDEPYGQEFMQLFWDEALRYHCEVVGVEHYAPETTDFRRHVQDLVGLNPKFVRDARPQVVWSAEEKIREQIREIRKKLSDLSKAADAQSPMLTRRMTILRNRIKLLQKKFGRMTIPPAVDFDALFIPDNFKMVGQIAPHVALYDVKNVLLLGTNVWHHSQLVKRGGQYVEQAVFVDAYYDDPTNAKLGPFRSAYQAAFHHDPTLLAAISYDTASFLVTVLQSNPANGNRDRLRRSFLETKRMQGVTGSLQFSENREIDKDLMLFTVYQGQISPLSVIPRESWMPVGSSPEG